jgi:2-dehydropantoate 2-reductase
MHVRILIVGAGATGGYLGSTLIAAGRDVTFLVHEKTHQRLLRDGLVIRTADGGTHATQVTAVTKANLHSAFDIIIVGVRAAAVPDALTDIAAAVGPTTLIIPVVNGLAHLHTMVERYGSARVCGGVATMATSMTRDGIIEETRPGATLQIGTLDDTPTDRIAGAAGHLNVDGLHATVSDHILMAMWTKFGFITSMTILTCLLRATIGPIARAPGGVAAADAVLAEVCDIAAADGNPLPDSARADLGQKLTDADSGFGPSMYRDMIAGRPVEIAVLADLANRGKRHQVVTPLLDASLVALSLHNAGLSAAETR